MDRFTKLLERGFDMVHYYASIFFEHWQKNTNQRTLIVVVLSGVFAGYVFLFLIRPPDTFPLNELVTVEQGARVSDIALSLEQNGVIRSSLTFQLVVRAFGTHKQLHAGDYVFKQPEDVFAVARAIGIGAYGLEPYRIRIPEGATVKEMAGLFARQLVRFKADDFIAKAHPLEGYLFPDTYFFLPNATVDIVIQTMRQNFDTQILSLATTTQVSGRPLEDLIIMASILEREARTKEDRRLIAGVLWRRLKIDMRLQADATLLYEMKRGDPITKKILATDTPYNTYIHKGLPPTPIGSPSLMAIEAAATPIDKGYLFYLADSNGVTHYSKTYAGQLANQRRYLGR